MWQGERDLRARSAVARETSLVEYGLRVGTAVRWGAADRRLLKLGTKQLSAFAVRDAAGSAVHAGGLVIDLPRELPHAWPWKSRWQAPMRLTGAGGGAIPDTTVGMAGAAAASRVSGDGGSGLGGDRGGR